MANTEGMPDEFVESLMTSTTSPTSSGESLAAKRQRERIRKRMELPMPEGGPSARIIRASPQNQAKLQNEYDATEESVTDDPQHITEQSPILAPMIGEVIERAPTLAKSGTSKHVAWTKKPSRFAQQQQQQQQQNQTLNGFPSVNLPLGTFIKPKPTHSQPQVSTNTTTQPAPPRPIVVRGTHNSKRASATSASSTNNKSTTFSSSKSLSTPSSGGITTESLLEASRRDASQMIEGMSLQEIQEEQRQLTAALSPDMIAFLKKRQQKQSQPATTTSISSPPIPNSLSSTTNDSQNRVSANTQKTNIKTKLEQQSQLELEAKKKLAELVSKVQTHQDLDQAYKTVMDEAHPLSKEELDVQSTGPENEFALACDLLRSTNPRQTLWASRIVQKHLAKLVQDKQTVTIPMQSSALTEPTNNTSSNSTRDWPLVLPVSLRCLLDEPIQANGGFVLHSYVLQSLYLLMQLTSHPDHIVHVSPTANPTVAEIFQEYFLEDAVPTPKLESAYAATPVQPLSMDDNKSKNNNNDSSAPSGAYATQSSSTSAQSDGEAFDKDPMWTLLSKMKIVPRLAQLLSHTKSRDKNHNSISDRSWPPEAWMAIIGILSMIAQRSPGAASAIAHHDTILSTLLDRILPCIQGMQDDTSTQQQPEESLSSSSLSPPVTDLEISFATLRLFGTLARQSRVSAQALPLDDILPPLLAATATTTLEFRLQRLALQLWRTLLRYGLGLEALESTTTAAAKHLALSYTHPYSLSTDFCAALAQVLECTYLIKSKLKNSDAISKIPPAAISTLSMTDAYLSATQRQVMLQPTATVEGLPSNVEDQSLMYRWNSARLRFLAAYWKLSNESSGNADVTPNNEGKTDDWSMEQVLACLEAMDEWTDPNALFDMACQRVGRILFEPNVQNNALAGSDDRKCEASACSFIEAFVTPLMNISIAPCLNGNRMVSELSRSVAKHALARIFQHAQLAGPVSTESIENESAEQKGGLAQRGWRNQYRFAVAKFMFHCMSIGELQSSSDLHIARVLVFDLMGRLELGNESNAAILLSQDVLFQATGNPLNHVAQTGEDGNRLMSPVSSMFLAELCSSNRARSQLDHSFKLQHGFGITKDGLGAFALNSLLSGADQPGPSSSTSDLSLPLGGLWLWQSLSGHIRMKDESVDIGTNEAANVVSAVLGLLLELEEGEDLMSTGLVLHCNNVPLGCKLYYLMNICLHHEVILRDDRILELAEALLERYWPRLTAMSIGDYARACLSHTDPSNAKQDDLEEKDKKLLEFFEPQTTKDLILSKKEMKSLEAFLDDLVEAYNDYGAQYDFFTKCMRLFLLPSFPVTIRCRALRDLRGILHLLTLPSEVDNKNELEALLVHSISAGIPLDKDRAIRDPPEILESVVSILIPGSTPRPVHGYILGYSVVQLARSLIISLRSGEGIETMTIRLVQLDASIVDMVCQAVSSIEATHDIGTKGIATATMNAIVVSEAKSPTASTFLAEGEISNRLQRLKSKLN